MSLFRIFFGAFYLVAGVFILNKHTSKINKYFSYTENVDLKWLRYVIIMIIVLSTTVIVVNVLSNFNDLLPYRLGDNIIFVVLTVVVFLNGYYGIKQQIIFTPSAKSSEKGKSTIEPKEAKKQYVNSGLTKEESQKYLQRLHSYMEQEQPYLNGKLSLKEVAEHLNLSPNHLSQAINENLGKNFFDFVNGYRVELIKQKMLDSSNSNLTLLGMAYDSGFNSKSSFNSIFKKHTSFTPSQYMRSQSA
jgi:AraC-like DNA-binding protein